jgi:hypothetical protein
VTRSGRRHHSSILVIAERDPIIHHFALSRFIEGMREPAVAATCRAHGDPIIAGELPNAG